MDYKERCILIGGIDSPILAAYISFVYGGIYGAFAWLIYLCVLFIVSSCSKY